MSHRKISANYIFTGTTGFIKNGILTVDEDGRVVSLLDTGGKLAEEANLEHYNGILCPGFVNAHCHLELSHMLGKIPRKTELSGFVEKIITSRKANPEEIYKAVKNADHQMKKEGIVAVGDICNTSDTFEIKANSRIYYHNFVEIFGTSDNAADTIFRNGQNLVQQALQKFSLKASITPHSAYSLGDALFKLIRDEKDHADRILSVHNQETISENDLIRSANGELYDVFIKLGFDLSSKKPQHKNSFPWLMEQLPLKTKYLMVHNLYTTAKDITDAGRGVKDIYWVLCPKSNYFIGGVYPGKYLVENFSERICIGTDSLASNDKLSVLEELFAMQENHPDIKLSDLLSCGTINGASALDIDKWCGSFEKDKTPGVILIENADIQNLRLKKESRVKVLV